MTRPDPPLLAVALLRRFLHDNEPLVGDLLERFAVRPSRLRFWREVIAAIVIHAWQHQDQERPLGLDGHSTLLAPVRPRHTALARHVNLSASPISHLGGLGLVALGGLVALVRPDVWWMAVPAILGGVALGVTLTMLRRRAITSGQVGKRFLG